MLALVLAWPTPTTPVMGTLTVVSGQMNELGASDRAQGSGLEFAANIALFVPFGLLLALVLPRQRWWLAVLGGLAVSSLAELVQEVFLPGRSGTVSDVVANTAGTVIGVGLSLAVAARVSRWRESSPEPPSGDVL